MSIISVFLITQTKYPHSPIVLDFKISEIITNERTEQLTKTLLLLV